MLNLLPDTTKTQLRAARANLILGRYTVIILLAFAFTVLILVGSYFLLTLNKTSSELLIESNDTKAGAFSDTQNQISQLSSNLSGARQILDEQIPYSQVLILIGQTMPNGAIIDRLSLTTANFNGTPVEVTVHIKSTETAAQVRQQFQNNATFSEVNLESISDSGGSEGYPGSARMTFVINRGALQ